QHSSRGLDHGAWVPLKIMYPDGDIPVLQMSLPTSDPARLLKLGARLSPLRDEGVLIIGSGFLTHGLPFLTEFRIDADAPGWSRDFDLCPGEALSRVDVDALASYQSQAPGMPYAHPTVEHYTPLFVTLGAATDPETPGGQVIDGLCLGLSVRALRVACPPSLARLAPADPGRAMPSSVRDGEPADRRRAALPPDPRRD